MVSFSASIVTRFEAGATFIFGSWLCIANQDGTLLRELRDEAVASLREDRILLGGVHGARSRFKLGPTTSTQPLSSGRIDPRVHDSLVGLQITSDFHQGSTIRTVTTTPRAPRNPNSSSRGTKTSSRRSRAPQFPFGLTNSAATYQKQLATKCHQPRQDNTDLVMTTTPSDVIVYWPDMDPVVALHEANVPSTEGRKLSVTTGNRKTGPNNLGRQSCVILNDDNDDEVVSDDAPTVDGETDGDRELRIEQNRNCALRRRHLQTKNLNAEFDKEGIFNSPAANIMFAVSVFEGFQATPDIDLAKARLEAAAVMVDRLDGGRSASKSKSSAHHRAPSARRQSSHYGSSAARTKDTARPREEPRRPREEPPRPRRREEPRPARSHITQNDARNEIIRIRERRATSHVADSAGGYDIPNPDALSCYTRAIRPPGVTNFDGKQDPNIWLRRYFSAIEASGGDDISKMLYITVAMEQGPLTWLESLRPDSIDSWHALKKAFISNYQGSFERPGSKYKLRACKQKPDESLRDYNRQFFATKAS
nr:unnamed protein product [Digitaria exilis]